MLRLLLRNWFNQEGHFFSFLINIPILFLTFTESRPLNFLTELSERKWLNITMIIT